MNKRKEIAVLAILLILLVISVSAVSADTPRPECDRSDANNLCQANITVFVFVDGLGDGGCDTFYNNGVDVPLEGARITFIMPDGSRTQRVSGHTGLLSFPNVDFLSGEEAFIEVEYPARYRGTGLLPCPGSPVRRRLTRDAFGSFGSTQVVFYARQHLPISSFASEQ